MQKPWKIMSDLLRPGPVMSCCYEGEVKSIVIGNQYVNSGPKRTTMAKTSRALALSLFYRQKCQKLKRDSCENEIDRLRFDSIACNAINIATIVSDKHSVNIKMSRRFGSRRSMADRPQSYQLTQTSARLYSSIITDNRCNINSFFVLCNFHYYLRTCTPTLKTFVSKIRAKWLTHSCENIKVLLKKH